VTTSETSSSSAAPGHEALRRLTPEEFRDVIGHFASGVTVITALCEDTPYGTTASAVSSLSLEPPMVLVCMSRQSETGRAVGDSGRFAMNILGEDQADAAVRFASKGSNKFDGVPVTRGEWGEPLLEQALATLECRVVEEVTGGTHSVFLAEVHRASARAGAPLAYFRGQFGRLELAPAERPVNDFEAIEDALRAGATIELGVAALRVGGLDTHELAEAQRLVETLAATGAVRAAPLEEWVLALTELLEHVISLAGSETLLDAYRRTNVAAITARLLASTPGELPLADAHRPYAELIDAYQDGDLTRATELIWARTERAIDVARHRRVAAGDAG
jgi:flavin reductase (DIM6/NTAB) family NADH-FMN oxidoreductase RutF